MPDTSPVSQINIDCTGSNRSHTTCRLSALRDIIRLTAAASPQDVSTGLRIPVFQQASALPGIAVSPVRGQDLSPNRS